MSSLAPILQRHYGATDECGEEYFSPKVLQAICGFSSIQSSYNVINKGSEHYSFVWEFLHSRHNPLPVIHDTLIDLCRGLAFEVRPRCESVNEPPFVVLAKANSDLASFMEMFVQFSRDGVISDSEDEQLELQLGSLERRISAIRAAKNAKRARRSV